MAETLETHLADPVTPVEEEVARLGPWFHNLHLPDGTRTAPDHPLGDFPAFKWRQLQKAIPSDLRGWKVLDVGCNAGFYSFELARRGADVLGIDVDPRYLRQAEWALRRQDLPGSVRFRRMQVYDLIKDRDRFDLIMFMGVFYHLRYPLLALDILAERTDRMLVFQSLTMPDDGKASVPFDISMEDRERLTEPGWPRMAFIEHRLSGDPTNWWVINGAAAEAVVRSAGLRIKTRPGHEIYVCEPIGKDEATESVMRAREQLRDVRRASR